MTDMQQRYANNPVALASVSTLSGELRTFLRSQLPEAMVPAHFVVLEELPKLPNGKVNRKELPELEATDEGEGEFLAPTTPDELRIAEIWRDLLGVSRIGLDDTFFELGGDSVTVVQMATRVRQEFGVEISLRRLFKNPTISALIELIGSSGSAKVTGGLRNLTDEELLAEVQLPDDLAVDESVVGPASTPYKKILLTGGTGYTGAFLLRELLERSDATIYVLVRARDSEDAVRRVRKNMETYGLWKDGEEPRLIGVAGDIGRPYFGLPRSVYEEVAREAEMIIHNAALSSYAMPYKQLKPVNVLGTLEVLRLASRRRVKPVHYVSSLSVFAGHPGHHHHEEQLLEHPDGLVGGYRQSKWVSERLMALARHRGIPTNIYRPGQITGSQRTGACSTDTYLNAAMKSCIQLGTQLDFDVMLEITPVDFCAKAVTYIALQGEYQNTQFHMIEHEPLNWNELIEMLRDYGYPLERVPYAEWYRRLACSLEKGEENALRKFFPLFGEDAPSVDAGDEGSKPSFSSENLAGALEGSGITCRRLDAELLALYLDYFVSIGYIPKPNS